MYVTKWLDLGEGPLQDKCRSHMSNSNGSWRRQIHFDSGSICVTFKENKPFHLDSDAVISWKDRKELFRKSWDSWPDNMLLRSFQIENS